MADTGKTVAVVAIAGIAGFGLYKFFSGKARDEVETGEWAIENVVIGKATCAIRITAPVTGDWREKNSELATMSTPVTVKAPGAGDWRPEKSELITMTMPVNVKTPETGDWRPEKSELVTVFADIVVKSAPKTVIEFEVDKPTAQPYYVSYANEPIAIEFRVRSKCSGAQTVVPVVRIHEHGAFGPGNMIDENQLEQFTISPGGVRPVIFTHYSKGAYGGKDVVVWLFASDGLAREYSGWGVIYEIIQSQPGQYVLDLDSSPSGLVGTISSNPKKSYYGYGELVRLTASAGFNWRFSHWEIDGEWLDSANPINFLVTKNHRMVAYFV